jgi:phosphocarrier protein HPr
VAGKSVHRSMAIVNQRGLHARAAAKFAQVASEFDAEISVSRAGQTVSGRSIMGLMMLAAALGCTVDLEISGTDADAAMQAICQLIERKFDEE